jgi:hypothetical protein
MKIITTRIVNGSTYNQESASFADGADFGDIGNANELRKAILGYAVDTSNGSDWDNAWIEAYESATECRGDLIVTSPDGLEILYGATN